MTNQDNVLLKTMICTMMSTHPGVHYTKQWSKVKASFAVK